MEKNETGEGHFLPCNKRYDVIPDINPREGKEPAKKKKEEKKRDSRQTM